MEEFLSGGREVFHWIFSVYKNVLPMHNLCDIDFKKRIFLNG